MTTVHSLPADHQPRLPRSADVVSRGLRPGDRHLSPRLRARRRSGSRSTISQRCGYRGSGRQDSGRWRPCPSQDRGCSLDRDGRSRRAPRSSGAAIARRCRPSSRKAQPVQQRISHLPRRLSLMFLPCCPRRHSKSVAARGSRRAPPARLARRVLSLRTRSKRRSERRQVSDRDEHARPIADELRDGAPSSC